MLADLAVARRFAQSGVWTAPLLSADLFRVFESWQLGRPDPVHMTPRRLTGALLDLGATWRKTADGRAYSPGSAPNA